MGKFVVIIGTQWGDEGKGKVVDLLTERAAAVARFQGGHNAGHTLVIDGTQDHPVADPVRHPARSGALLHRQRRGAVARSAARREPHADGAGRAGVRAAAASRRCCPLILPSHVLLDQARERARGPNAIGTTGRGIGPAYEDKVARRAVRVADLFQRDRFAAKLGEVLDFHNFVLQHYYRQPHGGFPEDAR